MSDFKFELDRSGVRQLLQCSEIQSVLISAAQSMAATANSLAQNKDAGYEAESSAYIGRNRANVSVRTANYAAMKDNLDNNTLEKAKHSTSI